MTGVTQMLNEIEQGNSHAASALLPLVYDELRKLAAQKLSQEKPGQTLQPTALVHEAYIRLVDAEQVQHWNSCGHFFAAAAEAMRRILVESARRKREIKRGGEFARVDLDSIQIAYESHDEEIVALNDALDKLATLDSRAANLVKLRYFAGLSVEEAAEIAGVSRSTAYEHWAFARAWLLCELHGGQSPPEL